MQRHHAAIRARGAEVVAVAQGTGDEAARFCRTMETDYPCLGDPEKSAYRIFSLPRDGWWNLVVQPFLDQPALAWSRIRRASLRGSAMKHSDPKQLGGVAIVDGAGVVRYLYRSTRTDDLPPTPDVISALDQLPG